MHRDRRPPKAGPAKEAFYILYGGLIVAIALTVIAFVTGLVAHPLYDIAKIAWEVSN